MLLLLLRVNERKICSFSIFVVLHVYVMYSKFVFYLFKFDFHRKRIDDEAMVVILHSATVLIITFYLGTCFGFDIKYIWRSSIFSTTCQAEWALR